MVVHKYSHWITVPLRSIPITGTSSLLWIHPTLLITSLRPWAGLNNNHNLSSIYCRGSGSTHLLLQYFDTLIRQPLPFRINACVMFLPSQCRRTRNQHTASRYSFILPMPQNQQFGSPLSCFRHVFNGSFSFNSITLTWCLTTPFNPNAQYLAFWTKHLGAVCTLLLCRRVRQANCHHLYN